MNQPILGVIPARYASTRFPGKPLALVGGTTLLARVWQRAQQAVQAGVLQHACIATDDERIFAHACELGAEVWMTRAEHPSGTDRLAEVAARNPGYAAYVNIQGDEPFVAPAELDRVAAPLRAAQPGEVRISTLAMPVRSADELHNPAAVKVVVDDTGRALYFSRSAIPFLRGAADAATWHGQFGYRKHVGLYGYTAAALERIRTLPPHPLELAESLEQLRWLAAGLPIYVADTDAQSPAIDTPEDLARVEALLAAGQLA